MIAVNLFLWANIILAASSITDARSSAVDLAQGPLLYSLYAVSIPRRTSSSFASLILPTSIEESDENFYIHYYPNKNNVLGNEAKIWVSKKDCSVIEKKFYQ